MNSHQRLKYAQLTQLAKTVTSGIIVELGTYQGLGAIALARGATVPVYTVDDYSSKRGWANEPYNPTDKQIFLSHLEGAKVRVTLVEQDVSEAAYNWRYGPISLLFWDLGIARLYGDFGEWQHLVTDRFVIHDTADNRFSRHLEPAGWRKFKDGVFWILQKER